MSNASFFNVDSATNNKYFDRGIGSFWVDKENGELYLLAQVDYVNNHKNKELWDQYRNDYEYTLFTMINLDEGNRAFDPVPWPILERSQLKKFSRVKGRVIIEKKGKRQQ